MSPYQFLQFYPFYLFFSDSSVLLFFIYFKSTSTTDGILLLTLPLFSLRTSLLILRSLIPLLISTSSTLPSTPSSLKFLLIIIWSCIPLFKPSSLATSPKRLAASSSELLSHKYFFIFQKLK